MIVYLNMTRHPGCERRTLQLQKHSYAHFLFEVEFACVDFDLGLLAVLKANRQEY